MPRVEKTKTKKAKAKAKPTSTRRKTAGATEHPAIV
jgi:hypothetical protein